MTKKGLISKIQHYSTKDGPGLRTTVFFMGCNLACKWCANPENLEYRKRVFYFKERCRHCGLCVQHAANHSIQFADVGCRIDRSQCSNLYDMVELCPFDSYELIGKEMEVCELVEKLKRDQVFYEIGEGGVTFSGGEAALQSDFLTEVCRELRKEKIHICLDTAGLLPEKQLSPLLEQVDMVLYDIKAMDEQLHRACTGVSNRLILENAEMIASRKIPMIIRMVVVPGYNDNEEDLKKRIDFVCGLGDCVEQVDILKYHIYGVGKYEKLNIPYPIAGNLQIDEEKIIRMQKYAERKGLKVTVGG